MQERKKFDIATIIAANAKAEHVEVDVKTGMFNKYCDTLALVYKLVRLWLLEFLIFLKKQLFTKLKDF